MIKLTLAISLTIFLAGCASSTPDPVLLQRCDIKLPADPIPTTNSLNKNSTPDQVIKAWVSTAVLYRGWNRAVRSQVEYSK